MKQMYHHKLIISLNITQYEALELHQIIKVACKDSLRIMLGRLQLGMVEVDLMTWFMVATARGRVS